MIFGRDVSKMPCFRNSYLYGIGSGIGSGLMYFMFTSKSLASCNFGMASFFIVTLSYWTQCRYKYSKTKFEMQRMQELLRQHQIYEGTETERNLEEELRNKTVDA